MWPPISPACRGRGSGVQSANAGGFRHVLRIGRVLAVAQQRTCATPVAAAQQFDGGRGQARPDLGVHQPVRGGVVVSVDLDVIVEVDPRVPVRVDVALGRGRLQRRPIEPLEERASGGADVPRRAVIELVTSSAMGRSTPQREEGPIAQPREDKARRHLDGDFDLRLVESRQLQGVLTRSASRCGSRTRFIR